MKVREDLFLRRVSLGDRDVTILADTHTHARVHARTCMHECIYACIYALMRVYFDVNKCKFLLRFVCAEHFYLVSPHNLPRNRHKKVSQKYILSR